MNSVWKRSPREKRYAPTKVHKYSVQQAAVWPKKSSGWENFVDGGGHTFPLESLHVAQKEGLRCSLLLSLWLFDIIYTEKRYCNPN